jgi:TetR/AcrR family transcriptional repressor of uid operon
MKLDLVPLLAQIGRGEGPDPIDRTGGEILDAAVLEAAAHGVAGLTTEGVARRAGVNRATVYRRFGDRDSLIEAMTMREGQRMATGIALAVARVSDPAEQFVEGFVASIRLAREHPIISRVASVEPEQLVAAGLADGGALLRLGSGFVAAGIRAAQSRGRATHLDADEAGETIARLFAAFVLLPVTQAIDLSTDASARAYASRTLGPMTFGSTTSNGRQ